MKTRRGILSNTTRVLTMMVLVAGLAGVLKAQEDDPSDRDLFDEVFGGSAEVESVVPVFRRGAFLGEVQARVHGDTVRIGAASLASILEPLLNPDALGALDPVADDDALVPIADFADFGIFLTYRPERIEVEVTLAPDVIRERVVGEGRTDAPENLQRPVDFSGYINLNARGVLASNEDRSLASAGFEPVLNYSGWVFESSFGVSSADDDPATLHHARIVRDFPSFQIRGEAGLVRYQRGALFRGPEILGVSATRTEEIDPQRPLYRREGVAFVVPRAAPVDIYLNQRLLRRVSLEQGPHRLPEIPLGRGINRVRVEQAGEQTEGQANAPPEVLLARDVSFAPRLLRPGRHAYSYALGLLRGERDPESLLVSGSHRMGVRPDWTAGAEVQAAVEDYALGLHSLVATPWGITRIDGAVFVDQSGTAGTAAEVAHVLAMLYDRRVPVVEVSGTVESPDYRPVLGPATDGGRFRSGVSLSQRLPGAVGVTTGVVHSRPFGGSGTASPETVIRVAMSHQSSQGFSVNAQIAPTVTEGEVYWRGSLFVRIGSDDRRLNTTVNYDLVRNNSTVQVSNVPRQAFGEVQWSTTYQETESTSGTIRTAGGSARYPMYRGSVQVQPQVRFDPNDDAEAQVISQFATALAWAGSTVAVTRPVRDSFVVFVPREEVFGHPIGLRPAGGATSAVLSGRAAVVPDLSSWRTTTIRFDGSRLPDGLSVGARQASFTPGYRSGYLVVVGSAAAVYATGRLVDRDGEPIDLEAGEIVDTDGNRELFFTNREGRFEIPELSAGRYQLFLPARPEGVAEIVVSEGERGEFRMGDVIFLETEAP